MSSKLCELIVFVNMCILHLTYWNDIFHILESHLKKYISPVESFKHFNEYICLLQEKWPLGKRPGQTLELLSELIYSAHLVLDIEWWELTLEHLVACQEPGFQGH